MTSFSGVTFVLFLLCIFFRHAFVEAAAFPSNVLRYADAGHRLPNPSRETKFSGINPDREIFIFPVQLAHVRAGLAALPS